MHYLKTFVLLLFSLFFFDYLKKTFSGKSSSDNKKRGKTLFHYSAKKLSAISSIQLLIRGRLSSSKSKVFTITSSSF